MPDATQPTLPQVDPMVVIQKLTARLAMKEQELVIAEAIIEQLTADAPAPAAEAA